MQQNSAKPDSSDQVVPPPRYADFAWAQNIIDYLAPKSPLARN